MLEDVAVGGEIYDTDFATYRADADLAWRARLMGHRGFYCHRAVARHRRVVLPERRRSLPRAYNAMSVRNRFLMRIKNEGPGLLARNGLHEIARDAMVVGYVLLREWSSIPALADVLRLMPRTLAKRREIQARRRVRDSELARWFSG
ncbi:MAG: hypothetical protein U0166_26915 [Acidobacteriota bacterium]